MYSGMSDINRHSINRDFTTDRVDLSKVNNDKLRQLVMRLSVSKSYDLKTPKDSIMRFEEICDHDEGYLCEHRLQYIIDEMVKILDDKD